MYYLGCILHHPQAAESLLPHVPAVVVAATPYNAARLAPLAQASVLIIAVITLVI